MSAVGRLFGEWFDGWEGDDPRHSFDREDLAEAFAAGWEARHNARWVTSTVPMLGIEGGEDRGSLDDYGPTTSESEPNR